MCSTQELMTVDEQPVRLALLRKAFQSDWDGAAPSAPSSNGYTYILHGMQYRLN